MYILPFYVSNSTQILIDETNIANYYDKKYKFKKSNEEQQWLDVTNGKYCEYL